MRFNDALAGVLLFVFGVAVVAYAQTFPPSPGQEMGPGLFPTLIGGGLGLCGLTLVRGGLKERSARWIQLDEWTGRPRMVLNGVIVVADLIFYALAVDRLGFFLTAFVFLAVPMAAFGVRWRWIPLFAALVTLGLHIIFYTVLHVPLPWGWLEGMAW